MNFLDNVWLLGLVAFGLVWIFRKFGWATETKQALWLTFAVSTVFAAIQITLQGQWPAIPAIPVGDPLAYAAWVGSLFGVITAGFGQVFVASQVIYQALRRLILGERI